MDILLSASNKIGYCDQDKVTGSKKVFLDSTNFQRITSKFLQRDHAKNSHVGVISVLGSSMDDHSRRLLTSRLIRGHESLDKTQVGGNSLSTIGNVGTSSSANKSDGISPGIYMWPKPLLIPEKFTQGDGDLLVWILFAALDPNYSNILDNFAALACSTILVSQMKDKDTTLKYIAKVKECATGINNASTKAFPPKLIIIVKDTAVEDLALADMWVKQVPPLNNFQEERINMCNFHQYLEMVTDTLNKSGEFLTQPNILDEIKIDPKVRAEEKTSIPSSQNSSIPSSQNSSIPSSQNSSIPSTQNPSIPSTQNPSIPSTQNSKTKSENKPTVPPRGLKIDIRGEPKDNKSESAVDKVSKAKPSDKVKKTSNDADDIVKVEKALILWLESSLAGNNDNAQLLENISPLYKSRTLEVVESIKIFQDQMKNMFDNFLCFHGESDKEQMRRFHSTAYNNTIESFRKKYPNHLAWQMKFLKDMCDKITASIIKDNDSIALAEGKLAQKVMNEIMTTYANKMDSYANHSKAQKYLAGTKTKELEKIHKRITDQCLSVFQQCMDSLDRNNNILLIFTDKLQLEISNRFNKMQQQNPHNMNSLPVKPKPNISHLKKPAIIAPRSSVEPSKTTTRSMVHLNSLPVSFSKEQHPIPAPSPSSARRDIIEKCVNIRQRITDKRVRFGVLLRKLVLDAVSKFENQARNEESTDANILSASMELNSFMKKHGL